MVRSATQQVSSAPAEAGVLDEAEPLYEWVELEAVDQLGRHAAARSAVVEVRFRYPQAVVSVTLGDASRSQ